jgi:hypothetical protein
MLLFLLVLCCPAVVSSSPLCLNLFVCFIGGNVETLELIVNIIIIIGYCGGLFVVSLFLQIFAFGGFDGSR